MSTRALFRDLARSRKLRTEFVKSHTKRLLPLQIRDLMEKLGYSQMKLAEESGLSQGTISRAIDPEYGNLTINTCVSIAGGCDVAFIGHFVPFSELDRWLGRHGSDIPIATFTEEYDENGELNARKRSEPRADVPQLKDVMLRAAKASDRINVSGVSSENDVPVLNESAGADVDANKAGVNVADVEMIANGSR